MRYLLSRLKTKRNIQTYTPSYNKDAYDAAFRQWRSERPIFDLEPFPTVTQHFSADNVTYGLHALAQDGITVRVISVTPQDVQEEYIPVTFSVELLIRTIRWVLMSRTDSMGCILSEDNGSGYFATGKFTNSTSLYMLPEGDTVTLVWTINKANYRNEQNTVIEQQYSFDKLLIFCEQLEAYAVSYTSFKSILEDWQGREPKTWQYPLEIDDDSAF